MNIIKKIKNFFFSTSNKPKVKTWAKFGTFIEISKYKYYQFEITDFFIERKKYYLVWVINNSDDCGFDDCVFYLRNDLNRYLSQIDVHNLFYGKSILNENVLITSIEEARNLIERYKKLLVLR